MGGEWLPNWNFLIVIRHIFLWTPLILPNIYIHHDAEDADEHSTEFSNKLRFWAKTHKITDAAINDLLSILIADGMTFLPADSKTFMTAPATKVDMPTVSTGKLGNLIFQFCS